MLYFSYGSNMSTIRMTSRVQSAQLIETARLTHHKLEFHKSSKDGSAKCDTFYTGEKTDFVVGVVYEIDPNEKRILDKCEGLGGGYEEKPVELIGSSDASIEAFTYYATNIDRALKPYSWYKEHVLRGAREVKLSDDYIKKHIEGVEAIEDDDRKRRQLEMSMYD